MRRVWAIAAVCVLVSSAAQPCRAQSLYLMTACERDPALNLGNTVILDEDNVLQFFRNHVPADRLKITRLQQEQLNPKGVIEAISKVAPTSKDTLVFYYSGHGAYNDKTGHYFDLGPRGPLPRSTVREALVARKAKFTALLTDCCFSFKRTLTDSPDDTSLFSRMKSNNQSVTSVSRIADSLFFSPTGVADWTSCSKGQVSVGYDDHGSLFTQVLIQYMDKHKDEAIDWNKLTTDCKQLVIKNFKIIEKAGVDRTGNDGKPNQFTQDPTAFFLPGIGEIAQRETAGDAENNNTPRFGARVRVNEGPGVKIVSVREGTPAKKLGLEAGDVILSIGTTIIRTLDDFDRAVDGAGFEEEVEVRKASDKQVYRMKFQSRKSK